MKLILIPHSSDQHSARLWLCATDAGEPPAAFDVTVKDIGDFTVNPQNWRPVTGGGAISVADSRTFVQVIDISPLSPGRRFIAFSGNARCRFSTLPSSLPRPGERPFTVLLGSCFFQKNDRGVGATMQKVLTQLQPDMKILCGDQLYFDFPAFLFGVPFSEEGIARSFRTKYLRNWDDTGSFQQLLAEGASWFIADDHEFWNNYPNPATIILNTLTQGGRDRIEGRARAFFQDFQCETPQQFGVNRSFSVGSLSFMIADTRVFRERGDTRFMKDLDLQEILDWLSNLTGPGVLVIGQPVFEQAGNPFKRTFLDRNLPDYEQYRLLSRKLLEAEHSVLILTGDVHFGRVAVASLANSQTGAEIAEIIASPCALVAGAHSTAPLAPSSFPVESVGIPSAPVRTFESSRRSGDNFATLQFTEVPGRVTVQVNHWYIGETQPRGQDIVLTLL